MRRLRWLLSFALIVAAADCGHTHSTDKATATASQPPAPATDHARPDHAAKPRTATPVASSAGGLLEPGAEEKIRDKLAADGSAETPADGGSLEAALKDFQRAHDLPATGTPDVETVRKLGLDPDQIFRKAAKPPN